ncbi:hypothetical protein BDZ85DRAFT_285264 [Elsinoe ampelina]|uniref:Uncharacterized protein n=1 Tax=Elsinoe ampelina TaxID=302913 RepID=A0A6A6G1W6_9PEZI|nr:hypothetical protein BDZ85DRAFT_285264 [Elsinoe ampelina]
MSRAIVAKHYGRLASLWPTDVLRPETQFQKVLRSRIDNAPKPDPEIQGFLEKVLGPDQQSRSAGLKEVNALYSLLENRYTKASPFSSEMMRPKSDPDYYNKLEKELEATPSRSWFGKVFNRVRGLVRLQ